ncbi:MAG TPA: STAS domain-containing protein [Candidatus Kapabacteria bacterium]|nr:STAS domain-containing protein [Candidatus Kapabacteria bacterium]
MATFDLIVGVLYDRLLVSGQLTGGFETDDFIDTIENAEKASKNLIIDFANCNFISSIVIGLLLKKHISFGESNLKLVIIGLNSILESVFKMTKMNTILYIEPNLESAEKKFFAK